MNLAGGVEPVTGTQRREVKKIPVSALGRIDHNTYTQ